MERSLKIQQHQKNRKTSAIEKRSNVLIRVDKGWIGLNPIPRVQKRVESGWLLRGANRGESGWPSGSKFGLGAGRAGRVHLAALISTELDNSFCLAQ